MNVVAFGAGSVWATNEIADHVYRIDPRTNAARVVVRTASPRGVAAGDVRAWVVDASPPSRDAALPSPACSAVFSRSDEPPRFVLVSDLPLQGESRPITQAIADGARHVLQQRGFEAGGYTVGFQSCDQPGCRGPARDAQPVEHLPGVDLRYDPAAKDFTPFARSVARALPDALIVADNLYSYSGPLIRALRAAAGPKPAIFAPDGFAGLYDGLVTLAGPAAKGMYISQYGFANESLPPRGREFLESFASGRPSGVGPDYGASYGAQAAEIFLDALARSDGTRASVTRELFRTRVTDGILGDIRFDRNGDLVDSPFTFVRMVGDRSGKAGLHPEVDRVVLARSARLRERR